MSGDVHVRFCEGVGVRLPRATHLIVGFEHRDDAERFWTARQERFGKCNVALHPEQTRLIEGGRCAAERRTRRDQGKPAPFAVRGSLFPCAGQSLGAAAHRQRYRLSPMCRCTPDSKVIPKSHGM
jgi:hypothetical protein